VGSLTSSSHRCCGASSLNPQPLGPSPPETDGRAWVASRFASPWAVGSSTSAGLGSFLNQFIASSMAFFFAWSQCALRHWCSRVRQRAVRVGSLTSSGLSVVGPVHWSSTTRAFSSGDRQPGMGSQQVRQPLGCRIVHVGGWGRCSSTSSSRRQWPLLCVGVNALRHWCSPRFVRAVSGAR
jgi:hypothetical protein